MFGFDMLTEKTFVTCLVITEFTWMLDALMFYLCVCDQDEQVWNFCDGPDGSHSVAQLPCCLFHHQMAYLSRTAQRCSIFSICRRR